MDDRFGLGESRLEALDVGLGLRQARLHFVYAAKRLGERLGERCYLLLGCLLGGLQGGLMGLFTFVPCRCRLVTDGIAFERSGFCRLGGLGTDRPQRLP